MCCFSKIGYNVPSKLYGQVSREGVFHYESLRIVMQSQAGSQPSILLQGVLVLLVLPCSCW